MYWNVSALQAGRSGVARLLSIANESDLLTVDKAPRAGNNGIHYTPLPSS